MQSLPMFAIAAAAVVPPLLLLAWRRLHWRQDFLLLFFYAESVAYIHLFPAFWFANIGYDLRSSYLQLSIEALVLFECPLLVWYVWARRRRAGMPGEVCLRGPGVALLGVLAVLTSVVFLVVSIRTHSFFTHTSTATIEAALLDLPLAAYILLRLYEMCGAATALTLLAAWQHAPRRSRIRIWSAACAGLAGGIYLVQRIVNSRLDVLLFAVLAAAMFLTAAPQRRFARRNLAAAAALLLLAGYGYRIALRARDLYGTTGAIPLSVLNPFPSTIATENPFNRLGLRLNGLDLMARIGIVAAHTGFAHGAAWVTPTRILWNNLTLNRSANAAYHLTLEDTPKRYLMLHYTTLTFDDYPNCILTDVYGNFGLAGFVLAATVIGVTLGVASRWLAAPCNGYGIIFALFFLQYALSFEQEFFTYCIAMVKFAPALAIVLLCRPFAALPRPRTNSGAGFSPMAKEHLAAG